MFGEYPLHILREASTGYVSHAFDQILAGDSRKRPDVDPLWRNDTFSYVSIQIILRRFVVVREVCFLDDASDEREAEYSSYCPASLASLPCSLLFIGIHGLTAEIDQPTVDSLNSFQVGLAAQKVVRAKHSDANIKVNSTQT
ncbi:hypothetical protein MMC22_010218 [Lobaria immixta]|nr:hypothetical protein [Lobaria immixta]